MILTYQDGITPEAAHESIFTEELPQDLDGASRFYFENHIHIVEKGKEEEFSKDKELNQ